MKGIQRFICVAILFAQAAGCTTVEKFIADEAVEEISSWVGLSAGLEPNAPELFQAIKDELAVCTSIVTEDDWSAVEGREEIVIDDNPGKPSTRERYLLSNNGLTQIQLGEVVGSSADDVALVFCKATPQKLQSSAMKIALHVEYAQWVRDLLSTTESKEVMCDRCRSLPGHFYSCADDQAIEYLFGGLEPIGIGILAKTRDSVICPVPPAYSWNFGKQEMKDRLIKLLEANMGPDVTIGLDECNLLITREQFAREKKSLLALNRTVQSADLKIYLVEDVEIQSDKGPTLMQIPRKSPNERVLAQTQAVTNIIRNNFSTNVSDFDDLTEKVNDQNSVTFSRLVTRITMDDDDFALEPNSDAAAFYKDSQRVEALPTPASYVSSTTYSQRVPSAASLVTGAIIVAPPLQFKLGSKTTAENLAAGLYVYSHENNCL